VSGRPDKQRWPVIPFAGNHRDIMGDSAGREALVVELGADQAGAADDDDLQRFGLGMRYFSWRTHYHPGPRFRVALHGHARRSPTTPAPHRA